MAANEDKRARRGATQSRLNARITGDVRTFSLAHRITNGVLVAVAAAAAASTCANLVLRTIPWLGLVVGSIALVHVGLYAWSRGGRAFPGPGRVSFVVLVLGFYPALWWSKHGLSGGNHLIGVALVAMSASQFQGWWRRLAVALIFVTTAGLIGLELHFPDAVAPYPSRWAQVVDTFISFAIVGTALHVLNRATDNSYAREREKARDYAEIVARTNRELEEALAKNRLLAHSDALTGLPNRRYLEPLLARRLEEAQRYRRPLALAVIDIDHFKSVNDVHGHTVGDEIIAGLGRTLATEKRQVDVAVRWGGEEFVLVCPETSLEGAVVVAERLRAAVEEACFAEGVSVTISLGLAAAAPDDDATSLFERADAALYAAKHAGRNRVVVAAAETPPMPAHAPRTDPPRPRSRCTLAD